MLHLPSLKNLVNNFEKLPGIGKKTAERMAFFILNQEKKKSISFADSILNAIENIKRCKICNMFTENDICLICSDNQRDEKILCVVESSKNVQIIEKTGEFLGKYFVLGNLLNPLESIGPDEIRFHKLKELISKRDIKEIVLAISPSIEGESTIQFLSEKISNEDIVVSRLSTGIPFGGNIDYSNTRTLGEAFNRRFKL